MATYSGSSYDGPTATGSPAGLAGSSVSPTQTTVAYSASSVTRVPAPTTATRTAAEWTAATGAAVAVSGLDGDSVAPTQSLVAYTATTVTRVSAPATGTRPAAERSVSSGIAATVSGLDGDSIAPTQLVTGFESAMVVRVAAPASGTRTGGPWGTVKTTAYEHTGLAGGSVDPTQSTATFNAVIGAGSVIPTSYFRKVEGRVLDAETGEPITNAIYVAALDNFAVVGNVTDTGAFIIYLLKQTYSEFILVADAGENETTDAEFDYVWYEGAGNPLVETDDDYVELGFEAAVPETGRPPTGLNIGGDLRFK